MMNQELGPVPFKRKSGAESFHHNNHKLGFDVRSFWQWSASDLLSNTMRGILAEFLVSRALGRSEGARAEWDPFDVTTESGIRVEVKSSAYIQSWHQTRLSRICFSTRPTRRWEATTNVLDEERKRQADVYVLCLLDHREQATVDPLNLAQWTFFVISTERLNETLVDQQTIGLNRLRRIGAEEVAYEQLAESVERAAGR